MCAGILVRLRPATEQDTALLLAVYASTRADELALTPWNAEQRREFVQWQYEAQQRHYAHHFPQSWCQVIEVNGQALGRLWLDRQAGALHVLDISLLPEARGQGVGSYCLFQLMEEAGAHEQQALSIHVEIHNPARRLYERLGFRALGEPSGLHQRMVWQAPTSVTNEETLP